MKRLNTILNYIEENKFVADIGSDHGITAIKIYEEKNPSRVIATDISKNSLQKLIDKLPKLNYDIETMVTDGIKELPKGVQEIVISGMGGFLIGKILERGLDVAMASEKLILQSNNCTDYLRQWLYENNFRLIDEVKIEEDGYIYDILVASYTTDKLSENYTYLEYKFGRKNIDNKDEVLILELNREISSLKNIVNKISKINSDKTINRCEEIKSEIKIMEDLLCKLKN